MGCSESKNFDDISLNDSERDLYNIELTPTKLNKYVVECLILIKYMSVDNLLQSKITFDDNIIQIWSNKSKCLSEFVRNQRIILLKKVLNIDEEELLGLVKKLPRRASNMFVEEEIIKNYENSQSMLLNDRMKLLLKKNAEKYYFKVYHKLKEKKSKIGSVGLEYLCTKIQIFKNITSLNLQLNKITFDGFICFAEVLKYLPNISELLLDYNSISSHQFSGLFSCFKFLPKLMVFGISENPIGDIGVISLNCEMTNRSFESLCRKLCCIKELEELDVGSNKITDKGVNCFISNCSSVYKLKYLWLNDNNIQNKKEMERRIRKNHKNKNLKIYISISKVI